MSYNFPLVSVVMCFYNEELFLEEAIQSILDQTYKNLELILVDDGSAESTTRIAKKYVINQPVSISYLEHENHINKGLSASRNKGIKHVRGKLIAFLDADDVFEPEYLANQVTVFNNTDATMVCEATKYWYSWKNRQKEDEIIPIGTLQDKLFQPQELNLLLYPLNGMSAAPCMCGIIVLRDALIKHEGFEESFTGMYEDQVFLAKMYYNEPVYISSACNNRYRQRPDSMMSTAQKKEVYIKIRTRFLEWFKDYLENKKETDSVVYNLVKKTLLPYKYPTYYSLLYVYPVKFKNKANRILNLSSNC